MNSEEMHEYYSNIVNFVANPQRLPEYNAFKFWIDLQNESISVHELILHMASWRLNKERVFILSILRHFPWYFSSSYHIVLSELIDMINSGSLSGLAKALLIFS